MIQKMNFTRPFIDCFYIEVENRGNFDVIFEVQMVYKGKEEVLKSQRIQSYYKARICVPMSAPNINLTVNILWHGYARTAYKGFLPGNVNRCYYLTGNFDAPVFMGVPC